MNCIYSNSIWAKAKIVFNWWITSTTRIILVMYFYSFCVTVFEAFYQFPNNLSHIWNTFLINVRCTNISFISYLSIIKHNSHSKCYMRKCNCTVVQRRILSNTCIYANSILLRLLKRTRLFVDTKLYLCYYEFNYMYWYIN